MALISVFSRDVFISSMQQVIVALIQKILTILITKRSITMHLRHIPVLTIQSFLLSYFPSHTGRILTHLPYPPWSRVLALSTICPTVYSFQTPLTVCGLYRTVFGNRRTTPIEGDILCSTRVKLSRWWSPSHQPYHALTSGNSTGFRDEGALTHQPVARKARPGDSPSCTLNPVLGTSCRTNAPWALERYWNGNLPCPSRRL